MNIAIFDTTQRMAEAAARRAAEELSRCVAEKGHATFMVATGTSQMAFLRALTRQPHLQWSKMEMYHLDEYVGLPKSHTASFRRYLGEHLLDAVCLGRVHLINGDAGDPWRECERLDKLFPADGVDVAFVGIGENAHLAFNDPPADFTNEALFTVVDLSDTCRAQQVHEGWFRTIEQVPTQAITITIHGILKAKTIISVVPERRKAEAVRCALADPVTPTCPASILREHARTWMFLDADAASLVGNEPIHQQRVRVPT